MITVLTKPQACYPPPYMYQKKYDQLLIQLNAGLEQIITTQSSSFEWPKKSFYNIGRNGNSTPELKCTSDSINLIELPCDIWLTGYLNYCNDSLTEIGSLHDINPSIGRAHRRITAISRKKLPSCAKYFERMLEVISRNLTMSVLPNPKSGKLFQILFFP
jgi:hypothetical protein